MPMTDAELCAAFEELILEYVDRDDDEAPADLNVVARTVGIVLAHVLGDILHDATPAEVSTYLGHVYEALTTLTCCAILQGAQDDDADDEERWDV